MKNTGRNDPCPCNSGKKYKTCCGQIANPATSSTPPPTKQASIPEAIQIALAHHQAGRLAQAEAIYRHILQREPNNPDALHLLGMAAYQTGNLANAIEFYRQVLNLNPDYAEVHNNLGGALKDYGKLDAAVASFREALRLKSDYAEAHYNLGNALKEQGHPDEAVLSYRNALRFKPDYVDAHNNLGNVFQSQGNPAEAAACYREVTKHKPDFAEGYNNLGLALYNQGHLSEAVANFQKALGFKPDYADAHNHLGVALHDQGHFAEAVACYRKALNYKPDLAEAYSNLGNALKEQDKLEESVANCRMALKYKPDFADAYNNLGNALKEQGKLDEAVASCRKALTYNPDSVEAHNNLGDAFKDQSKFDEAIACYRTALALKPDYLKTRSNMLFALNYVAGCPPDYYFEEACRYGHYAATKSRRFSSWQCAGRPERLRVGLVSGDLRNHPVGYFLENVLATIDTANIELIAYPTQYAEDSLSARIKPCFSAWKPLFGLSDAAAASLIQGDGVHILIDLSGHTAHNRLPMFAWKPAPVQASWLGYFATTGLAEMDYVLADPISAPESNQAYFTEKLWYLPDTRLCFTPPADSAKLALPPPPSLRNGGVITFGCFQDRAKLNDAVLAAWAKIFHALPQAQLRLQNKQIKDPSVREHLQQRLAAAGIAPERVTVTGAIPRKDYLAAHAEVDIILDTFPYPGGTTTCEALWMGVPTLTLAGDTMLARQGAGLLVSAGLGDWVATDEKDYAAKAVAHAADLERLAELRAGLRTQLLASPLFDAPRFARNLEAALWGMWRHHMKKQQIL